MSSMILDGRVCSYLQRTGVYWMCIRSKMSIEIRTTFVLWIYILSPYTTACHAIYTGVDIGNSCKQDIDCKTGNGAEYSKCNQDLNICICTINHLGEDKCMFDSSRYDGVCRKRKLYTKPGYCTLECSPKGTIQWQENQDWYGTILEPFALFIRDKETSACYDPKRAYNSLPDEFEIKPSTIPSAGLGAFAKIYIEQDTIFGPHKGIFEPDTDEAIVSGYSWKIDIREGEDRADNVWVDAKDVSMSNWLRYVNTPISAEMENVVAFQYKGQMYYRAFKPIHPGTEIHVWYGDSYGAFLEIEPFESPNHYSAQSGYVGGFCHENEEGQPCLHDGNTFCTDNTCFCVRGTHIRAGMCIFDETFGGICSGSAGSTCKHDMKAECQRGVCVCKNNSSPANGVCVSDESFGGRCNGRNGQSCLLDENSECVRGLCRCKYGTTGTGGKCIRDAALHGMCIQGKCQGRNAACDLKSNTCMCKTTIFRTQEIVLRNERLLVHTSEGYMKQEDGICQFSCAISCVIYSSMYNH